MRALTWTLLALATLALLAATPATQVLRAGRVSIRLDPARRVLDADFRNGAQPPGWHAESGSWKPTRGGMVGASATEGPAALWCDTPLPLDVAIVVVGEVLAPHANDLNAYFAGTGSLGGAGDHACYIAGSWGWWTSRHGLERYPSGFSSTVPAAAPPGHGRHELVTGRVGGHLFLFVDGKEILTTDDSTPIPADGHDRMAVATWASTIRVERVEAYALQAAP